MAEPLGDDSVNCVAIGNVMVARCVLIILLAASRGIFWVLEQPRGSLLEMHPAFQLLMRKLRVWRKALNMAAFGGESEKPTWLYSGQDSQVIVVMSIFSIHDIGIQKVGNLLTMYKYMK